MSEKLDVIRAFFQKDVYAMETTGVVIEEVGDGFAVCSLVPDERHVNADGVVQGGALYTLADFCFAVAENGETIVREGLPNTVTLNAAVNYLRPAKLGEKLVATAKRVKGGRTACYYEVNVTADKDRERVLCAVTINGIVTRR